MEARATAAPLAPTAAIIERVVDEDGAGRPTRVSTGTGSDRILRRRKRSLSVSLTHTTCVNGAGAEHTE